METGVMRHRAPRSAAPREATAETARETVPPHAPGRWQRSRWQRIWRRVLPPPETALSQQDQVDQLNRQLALLEGARTELEAGWIQGAWWAVSSADGGHKLVGGLEAGLDTRLPAGHTGATGGHTGAAGGHTGAAGGHTGAAGGLTGRVDGVCLVGALARAGRGAGAESPDTGRAVDAVYDALWDSRGQPAASAPGIAGTLPPVPSPQLRLARVRTLTQWNDSPGRTKPEVLTLVDQAISTTILTLAATPRPDAPQPDAPRPETRHPS